MSKSDDLVPIEINLKAKEEGLLNESYLAMMGGAIQTILTGMFGNEAKYLKAMKRYGLDKPETLRTKTQLDRAIKSFERDTGIKWPFK